MAIRHYSNAGRTTLVGDIGATDTTITVADASGFPALTPFTLILDLDEVTEEVVEVTSKVGNQLTVTRGVDGTTAFPHSDGAAVAHGVSARDFREVNTHVNTTGGVHGVQGDLVGTTDTQTLTNKTLTGATINGGTITAAAIREATVIQPTTPSGQVILRDSAGIDRGFIDGNAVIQGQRLRAMNEDPANIPLIVRGASEQTLELVAVRDNSNNPVFIVHSNKRVGVNTAAGSAVTVWVKPVAATDVGMIIQGVDGQSGHLLRMSNSASQPVAWFDANGRLTAANFEATDWQSYEPGFSGSGSPSFTHAGRWKRVGTKTVAFRIQITFHAAGAGSGICSFMLPTTPNRTIRQTFHGHMEGPGGHLQAVVFTGGSGRVVDRILLNRGSETHNLIGSDITANTIITIQGTYEEA
jgi:hypothetical protein